MGRNDEALAAYEQSINLDPQLLDVHKNAALLYSEMGQPQMAILQRVSTASLSSLAGHCGDLNREGEAALLDRGTIMRKPMAAMRRRSTEAQDCARRGSC